MSSRSIFLIGTISSILYIYFVLYNISIFKNQEQIKQELSKPQIKPLEKDDTPTIQEILATEKEVVESVEKDLDENLTQIVETEQTIEKDIVEVISDNRISIPAFGFISTVDKNQIVALMSDHDQDGILAKTIKEICQKQECIKDLSYEKDVIDASWQKPIASIVQLISDKKIKDGSLFVESNTVKIEGKINDKNTSLKVIEAIRKIKEAKLKVENYSKDIIISGDKNKYSNLVGIDIKQQEINNILKSKPIIFNKRSSKLTKQSKVVLDQIVKILKTLTNEKIVISGHTDSRGSKVFNQVLSQTRADTVLKYLKRKSIKADKIRSIAYGAQKPNQSDPKDPKNRRVEILLVKGE
jgi:outer membrane protein OmpA-like peptidoglycan-associated protein